MGSTRIGRRTVVLNGSQVCPSRRQRDARRAEAACQQEESNAVTRSTTHRHTKEHLSFVTVVF
jgi:hypothetical protein